MNLLQSLRPECFATDIPGRDKEEVFQALAQLACRCSALSPIGQDMVLSKLKEREAQGTTALGNGVAFPHARLEGVREFVVGMAMKRKPVHFDAVDGKKCRFFVFVLGPENAPTEHLQALAGLSRVMGARAVHAELAKAKSSEALHEAFARRLAHALPAAPAVREKKMLIITLYIEERLFDLLQVLLEEGIDGASILNSSGMGKYVSSVPIFADFIGFMRPRKDQSQTILALIPAEREQQIVEKIEEVVGDLDKTEGAFIATMNIAFHKGTMRMM